jgi:hypothetical protein
MRCLVLLLFSISINAYAVPQSGIWSCGASGNYSFFPGTYISLTDVEMDSIKVVAQLYPGFAVIKGKYFLKNTGSNTIALTGGFPADCDFDANSGFYQIRASFPENYYLRVLQNDSLISYSESGYWHSTEHEETHGWHLWTNTLFPNRITKVEIYTIISTNNSLMTSNWSESDDNVFAYIVECGMWSGAIRSGSITLQLMDGLHEDDFRGFAPDSLFTFYPESNTLHWSFQNITMSEGRYNIIFPYGKRLNNPYFKNVIDSVEKYISAVDGLDRKIPAGNGEVFSIGDPFNFETATDDPVLIMVFFFILVVVSIILAIVYWNRKPKQR